MNPAFPKTPKPEHVPDNLVHLFPYIFGMTTDQNPFTDMVKSVQGFPDIFYANHAYPGGTPAWIIQRTEDLRAIYMDTEHFSSTDFSPFSKMISETWTSLPAEIDPPDHSKYRTLLMPLFSPKVMAKLDVKIRLYAKEYVQSFKDKGECEFMAEFAFEFPIKVFMELMGLPLDMTQTFLEWEMCLLHNHDMASMADAVRKVTSYLREQIADRRENPQEDLITWAVNAEVEGRPWTEDELVGFTFNLFIGGLDTVSTNMGLHFSHLAQNPEQQKILREDPSLIPTAIEELMRAYPAVTTFRTCIKETEIKGVKFMPGDKVTMSTTLAGRDPKEFENPDVVDFNRKARHVSFGNGTHLCLGIHLARREMRIAMEEFLQAIPEFNLPEGYVVKHHLGMIQPVELTLCW